jgi:hypothetical protein
MTAAKALNSARVAAPAWEAALSTLGTTAGHTAGLAASTGVPLAAGRAANFGLAKAIPLPGEGTYNYLKGRQDLSGVVQDAALPLGIGEWMALGAATNPKGTVEDVTAVAGGAKDLAQAGYYNLKDKVMSVRPPK